MTGISIRGIAKSFGGGTRAVDGVSFEVKQGELVTLLGPSGCGKTTTLRLLAGLETLDEGEIYVGDRLLSAPAKRISVAAEKRSMGMVFQSYAVWPHMTVAENVAFPLEMHGIPRSERAPKVTAVLKLVGLDGFADRPATQLSGGQQQRVALARALVFNPEVLLLDEPFSNLDAKLREEMRFEVKDLQQRLHLTAVFVTHDQREAMILSDRVIVMNAGRVEQEGPPGDVYRFPGTPFVLDFFGQVNYVPAQVANRAGVMVAEVIDQNQTAVSLAPDGWLPGEAVTVAFRKEDAVVEANPAGAPSWSGVIHSSVFVGREVEYVIDLGRWRVHAMGPSHGVYPPGTPVQVKVREEALHVQRGRPPAQEG